MPRQASPVNPQEGTIGMDALIIAVTVVVAALVGVLLYKLLWRVAGPNEVLVILRRRDLGNPELPPRSGLRVVTGRGALVKPGVETARRLSLAPREAPLAVDCLDKGAVPLRIKGVLVFKVGDDYTSIAKAAGRFLDTPERLNADVDEAAGTNLRAIVADMTAKTWYGIGTGWAEWPATLRWRAWRRWA